MMEEALEKCIPPKSILLQILQGLTPNQANVTGLKIPERLKDGPHYLLILVPR